MKKPKYGEPCNGCGFCCKVVPCPLAIILLQERVLLFTQLNACPALEFEDGRYWCGLIRNAHKYIPGMENKLWIDQTIRNVFFATGAFNGTCDSEDVEDDL